MISDFNISFTNGSNNAKTAKTIRTNRDWGIAFTCTKRAIIFTYPHHSDKLNEYEEYIIGQFAGVEVSQHSQVLNLDRAIQMHESQSNHLLLTSFSSFSDLITNHLISPQGNQSHQNSNKRAKNAVNTDAPICRRWNTGKCATETCQYKHVCSKCQAQHQAKDCTSATSGGGT